MGNKKELGLFAMGRVHPAVIAAWAAFLAVVALLPAIPVVGTGFTFSVASLVMPLAGVLFGPVGGALAAGVGGFIGQLIAPHTAIFGMLTFLCPMLEAFVAGCLMRRQWVLPIGIWLVLAAFWYGFPLGRDAWLQPLVNYTPGVIAAVLVGIFGARWVASADAKKQFVGVALCSFAGAVASMALGNSMALIMFRLPREVWYAVFPIAVPQRLISGVVSAVIGVPLMLGLNKVGLTVGPNLFKVEEEED